MNVYSNFVLPAGLFVLALVFGVWLSLSGKPYNGALFNIHKLLALAAVVLAVIKIINVLKVSHPQTTLIGLLVLAGLCVILLFASGVVMSIGKGPLLACLWAHRILPLILLGSTAGVVYLLHTSLNI